MALVVKNPPANAGDVRDVGSIPGSGRSPGGEHGSPIQYSWLGNTMDWGAGQVTVHRVSKSHIRLKWFGTHKPRIIEFRHFSEKKLCSCVGIYNKVQGWFSDTCLVHVDQWMEKWVYTRIFIWVGKSEHNWIIGCTVDICTPRTGSVCWGRREWWGVSRNSEWSPSAMVGVSQLLASGNGRRWVMRGDRECV